MDKDFDNIERIEKYLNNTLSETEKVAFEKELGENTDLAKEQEDFQNIQKGLKIYQREKTAATIKSIHEELKSENFFTQTAKIKSIMENQQEKKKSGIYRILSIAAGVAFLAGAAYFFMQTPSPSKADMLAKTEVKADIDFANAIIKKNESLGFADEDKGKKDTLMLIATNYKAGNYDIAIKIINEYIERYSPDFDVQYMLGSCMFQNGEYAKAVKHFLPLLELESAEERQDIQWMTALSYLRFDSTQGDSNAKKILQQMLKTPGDYDPQDIQGFIDLIK